MQRMAEWDEAETLEIAGRHAHREGPLLPILHEIQETFGCVPRDAIPVIAATVAGGDPARAERLERYLRRNIRYDLDDAARRGLVRYLSLVMQDGLAASRPDVVRAVESLGAAAPAGR